MMAAISTWEGMPWGQRATSVPSYYRGGGAGSAMNVEWEFLPNFVKSIIERGFISFFPGEGALSFPDSHPPRTILDLMACGSTSGEAPVVTASAFYEVYKDLGTCEVGAFGYIALNAVLHALNVIAIKSANKDKRPWLKMKIGMIKGVHPDPISVHKGACVLSTVKIINSNNNYKIFDTISSGGGVFNSPFVGEVGVEIMDFLNDTSSELKGISTDGGTDFTCDLVFGIVGAMIFRAVKRKAGESIMELKHLRAVVYDCHAKWTSCALTPLLSLVESVMPMFEEGDRTVLKVLSFVLMSASWRLHAEDFNLEFVVLPNLGAKRTWC
jgi:hypothetical protein